MQDLEKTRCRQQPNDRAYRINTSCITTMAAISPPIMAAPYSCPCPCSCPSPQAPIHCKRPCVLVRLSACVCVCCSLLTTRSDASQVHVTITRGSEGNTKRTRRREVLVSGGAVQGCRANSTALVILLLPPFSFPPPPLRARALTHAATALFALRPSV